MTEGHLGSGGWPYDMNGITSLPERTVSDLSHLKLHVLLFRHSVFMPFSDDY